MDRSTEAAEQRPYYIKGNQTASPSCETCRRQGPSNPVWWLEFEWSRETCRRSRPGRLDAGLCSDRHWGPRQRPTPPPAARAERPRPLNGLLGPEVEGQGRPRRPLRGRSCSTGFGGFGGFCGWRWRWRWRRRMARPREEQGPERSAGSIKQRRQQQQRRRMVFKPVGLHRGQGLAVGLGQVKLGSGQLAACRGESGVARLWTRWLRWEQGLGRRRQQGLGSRGTSWQHQRRAWWPSGIHRNCRA
mmetsp:Transcript_76466/g.167011  ORF Transcript_76466/g.167011 Transcript_76466/m.167011 type:complete len:245 (-) Transcript_76466:964-1698(-)